MNPAPLHHSNNLSDESLQKQHHISYFRLNTSQLRCGVNWNNIQTLFVKDWKELVKSKQALLPMVIFPLLFVIVIPVIVSERTVSEVWAKAFLSGVSPDRVPPGLSLAQSFSYVFLMYTFIPFFLAIPAMLSSVIASTTFAGEKERKTIEGLLYTPLSDRELILSKILVAFVPSWVLSLVYFIAYTFVVNLANWDIFQRFFFPTLPWVLMILFLVPTLAFVSLSLIVAVSQRVSSIWEAQQITVVVILPLIGVLITQAAGAFLLTPTLILISSAILLLVDIAFFTWIVKTFNREHIITNFI